MSRIIPPRPSTDRCWRWHAIHKQTGRARAMAHKRVWEAATGRKVPPGWHLHHTCETVECVNPWHLRLMSPSAHGKLHAQRLRPQRRKRTCSHGHDLTDPAVVRIYTRPDGRIEHVCRVCSNARKHRT